MKSILLSVILLLSLACSTAHSKVPPSVSSSVFVLQVDGDSLCTAFTVEDKQKHKKLISAGHCATRLLPTTKVIAYNSVSGARYPVTLLTFKSQWPEDYSIFAFTGEVPATVLTIAPAPEIGDEIWTLMAPLGMNPFYVPGYFAGPVTCSDACEPGGMFAVVSPVGPGSSGSPAMDSRGRVWGIMVGSHPRMGGVAIVASLPEL